MREKILKFELSIHAKNVVTEREIPLRWIEEAFSCPQLIENDRDDDELHYYLKEVAEFDNRVLRVVANDTIDPAIIVTAYFDRDVRGEVMKVCFDEKSDAIYIRLDRNKKIIESQDVENGVVLDFDDKNNVIGIEITRVKNRISMDQLKELTLQIA